MHPLFKSGKKIALTGLLWSLVSFWVIMLHKLLTGSRLIDSFIFIAPPMIIELFIAISLWYICKSTTLSNERILNFYFKHTISLLTLSVIFISSVYGYSLLLSDLNLSDKWRNMFFDSIPLLTGVAASVYILTSLLYYLIIANEKIVDAEKRVLHQELETMSAELKALKTTVHPHFLFNSLNLLKPLLKKDPKTAAELVSRLSEFLIYSYSYGSKQISTVEHEIEHIRNYLEIERLRLGDRLQIEYIIKKTSLRLPLIPLILLPLAENAIKHGISQLVNGGKLSINMKKHGSFILFEFKNPYDETIHVSGKTGGHGLTNLEKRIKLYYGDKAGVLNEKDGKIFTAKLFIPLNQDLKDGKGNQNTNS